MQVSKFAPWILSTILAALLVAVFITKNTEIDSLHQQYDQLVADTNKKLEEADKKHSQALQEAQQNLASAEAKQEIILNEAGRQIAAASLPETAVSITFRPAMLGSGYVAQITNISGASAAFVLEIRRPSTGQTMKSDFVLNTGLTREIGHREGWAFVSGDQIAIAQPNHKPKLVTLQ